MIDIEEMKFFYLNKGKKAKKIKRVGDYKNSTNSKCFKIRLGNNDYLLKVITGGDDYQVKCSFMPQCFESGELKFDDENYKYYLYEYIDGFVISENNKYKLNEKSFESLINLEICLHNKGVCIFDMNAYNFIHTPNDRIVLVDYGALKEEKKAYEDFRMPCMLPGPYEGPIEYNYSFVGNDGVYSEKTEIFYLGLLLKDYYTLDNKIKKIILKVCEYNCEKRYKTFEEIKDDLIKL